MKQEWLEQHCHTDPSLSPKPFVRTQLFRLSKKIQILDVNLTSVRGKVLEIGKPQSF